MHPLGINPIELKKIEALGEGFARAGLLEAQRLSWLALQQIAESIKPGMTEHEATIVADKVLRASGSPRSWHRTIVRFGEDTALPYWEKGTPDRVLASDDLLFVDIGPNWTLPSFGNIEYEGDVGHAFITGQPNEAFSKCIRTGRLLFEEGSREWHQKKLTGAQLYEWLSKRAVELGYEMVPEDDGHRIGDFPHKRFFEKGLTGISFTPTSSLWVLEVHLIHPSKKFGAFFEDVLHDEGTSSPIIPV